MALTRIQLLLILLLRRRFRRTNVKRKRFGYERYILNELLIE